LKKNSAKDLLLELLLKEVSYKDFSEKIESFWHSSFKKTESFRIKKDDLTSELTLKDYVKKR